VRLAQAIALHQAELVLGTRRLIGLDGGAIGALAFACCFADALAGTP